MKRSQIILFNLGIALCISSCCAAPRGKANAVATSLLLMKNVAGMTEKSLAMMVWVSGKSIACCARYPRLTLFASTSILLSCSPVRQTIGDYSYRYLVASLAALSNRAQSAVRNYILGSLPGIVSETNASIESHTQQLKEMADSLQLLQAQCGLMQASLDRVEKSATEHQESLLAVQQSCDGIKRTLEEQVGNMSRRLDLIQENQQQQLNCLKTMVEHAQQLDKGKSLVALEKNGSSGIYNSLIHLLVGNGNA